MGNLINLRFLSVTTKQRTFPGKENGTGCLISLRCLWIDECDNLESMFEGIQNLNALRTLIISNCPSLVSLSISVKHLTALENLIIYNCERLDLMDGGGDEENGTQGSSSSSGSGTRLRSFMIVKLPKLDALPHWLIHGPTATTLCYLHIASCHNLSHWKISFHSRKLRLKTALHFQLCHKGCIASLHYRFWRSRIVLS